MPMMTLDRYTHAASFNFGVQYQFAYRALATKESMMNSGFSFEYKPFEVAEVIVDESFDLPDEFLHVLRRMVGWLWRRLR